MNDFPVEKVKAINEATDEYLKALRGLLGGDITIVQVVGVSNSNEPASMFVNSNSKDLEVMLALLAIGGKEIISKMNARADVIH